MDSAPKEPAMTPANIEVLKTHLASAVERAIYKAKISTSSKAKDVLAAVKEFVPFLETEAERGASWESLYELAWGTPYRDADVLLRDAVGNAAKECGLKPKYIRDLDDALCPPHFDEEGVYFVDATEWAAWDARTSAAAAAYNKANPGGDHTADDFSQWVGK